MIHVAVIGGGPAGLVTALRAADLGAHTILLNRGDFGGMAANDGPVPVRTLAHAARLMREARQLEQYGIAVGEPLLDYPRLLARVRQVVDSVRAHSTFRPQLEQLGVDIREHTGNVRFVAPQTLETERGERIEADRIVICTGGVSRRLPVPGFELTATHSDAWNLTAVPHSMLVIGAGATGAQVASIFNAFGTKIQLFQAGPRILHTEDEDVSKEMAAAFRANGIQVNEDFGTIESFEKVTGGVRMTFAKNGHRSTAEAEVAVIAVGWVADAVGLNLAAAGVTLNSRGYIEVDRYLRTSSEHIFAAGDVTGRVMLVPHAIQDGFVAATNAVNGCNMSLWDQVSPIGSFTDPEYAQVGLTEAMARKSSDVQVSRIGFDTTTRTIIDGHTIGFCKIIVDRSTRMILGCHVVGERAVEIAQLAAIAMTSAMTVDQLARIPLSFPTYAGVLGRLAASAARQLNLPLQWQGHRAEG